MKGSLSSKGYLVYKEEVTFHCIHEGLSFFEGGVHFLSFTQGGIPIYHYVPLDAPIYLHMSLYSPIDAYL